MNIRRRLLICILIAITVCCLDGGTLLGASTLGLNYIIVAENEYLRLYLDPDTTEIAVNIKANDSFWYSNPPNRDVLEKIAGGSVKEELNAQFSFTYGDGRYKMNNYVDSVVHQQYEIAEIDNGVRIDYIVGERYKTEDIVPIMIKQDRFEQIILASIDDPREGQRVLDSYVLVSLEEIGDDNRIALAGLDMDKLFGEYKLVFHDEAFDKLEEEIADLDAQIVKLEKSFEQDQSNLASLIRQRDNVQLRLEREKQTMAIHLLEMIRDNRKDIERVVDLSFVDLMQLVETPTYTMKRIAGFMQRELQRIIDESSYTFEDVRDDAWDNNLDQPNYNTHVFEISLEYFLDGSNLIAQVPANGIIYPHPLSNEQRDELINQKQQLLDELTALNKQLIEQIESVKGKLEPLIDRDYQALVGEIETLERKIVDFEEANLVSQPNLPILNLTLLPYFGAAYLDQSGYIFVPDGSGALINLNNGKTSASPYSGLIYGADHSLARQDQGLVRTLNHLPVYGIKQGSQAFLAIIEDGEALARIHADIAGKLHSYNVVYPQFTLRPSANIVVRRYQSRLYQGDIRVRYSFLNDESANYVGMAHVYQDYLQNQGLKPLETEENIPFFLDLIGAIEVNRPIMGISRKTSVPLTTYEQADQILTGLGNYGIDQVLLRYIGWLEDGIKHVYPSAVRLESVLGTKQELEKLAESVKQRGGQLYPGVNFINVYPKSRYSGFSPTKDAARFLDGLLAKTYSYNVASYQQERDNYRFILSPSILDSLVDDFFSSFQSYAVDGLALLDLGLHLNSDFRTPVERTIDRQQSANLIREQLEKMKNDFHVDLLVEGANAYTLPYVSKIVQMPIDSTNYNIVDQSIPFYQIALHGFIDYAASPINMSGDERSTKLKLLETGTLPYYQWCYVDSAEVKGTDFEELYSLHYGDWLTDAVEFYQVANSILNQVRTERIIDHQQLANNVYKTVYQNEVAIIVNYNDHSVLIDNLTIEPLGFHLVKEDM